MYAVREIAAPSGYLVNETVFWAEIKVHDDLIRFEVEDGNEETSVTIQKIGNVEAMPGDVIRYDLTNISNASNVELDDFYVRDMIPTDALRLEKIVTGRWSERLTYRVEYRTNYKDWRTLKSGLSTQVSHTLDCGREALGLRADEAITQIRFRFGTVQPGFHDLDGVKLWLMKRLRLEVSEEKTKIINVKRRYSEFLGFKIKVHSKAEKQVVTSHICDKRLRAEQEKLTGQVKQIVRPRHGKTELDEIRIYNSMVMGIQEYYKIATAVNLDCRTLNRAVMTVLTSRLKTQTGNRLVKTGRKLTKVEKERYGKSAMIRYIAGSDKPIYPIGYIQHKHAKGYPLGKCYYSPTGRRTVHENLRINVLLMLKLMRQPSFGYDAEYMDNRLSLFSAQWGKCAVTGRDFRTIEEIHCRHKTPKEVGGGDEYGNLVLVLEPVRRLIHAKEASVIARYNMLLGLDQKQMTVLNKLRCLAGLPEIN